MSDFESIKKEIEELEKKRWHHYKKWQEYNEEYKKMKIILEEVCEHKWEIDTSNCDHRTSYICSLCGA
jgi:hypothetical protein